VRTRGVAVVAVLAFAVTLFAGACHHDAAKKAPPPADVVPDPASAFTRIVVSNGSAHAELTVAEFRGVAPLVTGRVFASKESLDAYGLAGTQARLDYFKASGESTTLRIGAPTFDAHGFYVQKAGDPRVYVVPGDNLRPLLARVGLVYPAPK
jgi:hypothetical protein